MTETRTLLVEEQNGKKFKITIPADYKVTFGSSNGNRGMTGAYEGNQLRIYEAESKQRACFVGVKSFRDLSLELTRLVVSEDGSSTWSDDGEGNVAKTMKASRKVREVRDEPVTGTIPF